MKIIQTIKHSKLVGNKWYITEEETKEISRQEFDLIVANRFKGDRYYRTYTSIGYVPYKIVSRFDNLKTVRDFQID